MKKRARVYRDCSNKGLFLDFNEDEPTEEEDSYFYLMRYLRPTDDYFINGCPRGLRKIFPTIPLPHRNKTDCKPQVKEIDVTILAVGSPEHNRQERVDHLLDKIDKATTDAQLLGYARQLQQVRRG